MSVFTLAETHTHSQWRRGWTKGGGGAKIGVGQSLKVKVGIFLFSQLKIKPPLHTHTQMQAGPLSPVLPISFLRGVSVRVCVCAAFTMTS